MIIQATYRGHQSLAGYVCNTEYWLYVEKIDATRIMIRPVPAMLAQGEIPRAHSYADIIDLFKEWDDIHILSGSWHPDTEREDAEETE